MVGKLTLNTGNIFDKTAKKVLVLPSSRDYIKR